MLILKEVPDYTREENIKVDIYLSREDEYPVESFIYNKLFKNQLTERLFRWYGHKGVFGIDYDHERQWFVVKVALTEKVETGN